MAPNPSNSSSLDQPVLKGLSILLQIQILKASNRFLSAFVSVQVSAAHRAILQTMHRNQQMQRKIKIRMKSGPKRTSSMQLITETLSRRTCNLSQFFVRQFFRIHLIIFRLVHTHNTLNTKNIPYNTIFNKICHHGHHTINI